MRVSRIAFTTLILFCSFTLAAVTMGRLRHDTQRETLTSSGRLISGQETILVFVGASFCAGSTAPDIPAAVSRIIQHHAARAVEQGYQFASIGVAIDWSVDDGLPFIRSVARFDEVVVGRNWLNSAVARYIWRDIPGDASLPQILILQRHIRVQSHSIDLGDETLLARKVGADEIRDWAARGAPL